MGTIYLRRYDRSGSNNYISYWYKIPIFDDFNIDFNSPVSPMPLPEEDDEEQILVKVEGNSATVTVSWLIKEESSNMGAANTPNFTWGTNIRTTWEQVAFLQSRFVPKSVDDNFDICVDSDDSETGIFTANADFDFKKAGTISKVNFRIPSNEPATVRASITFTVGNVVTAYALDVASPPKDFTVTSTVSGRMDASWSAPRTTNGSIKYNLYYTKRGTTVKFDEPLINATSIQLSGFTAGDIWDVYVRAISDADNSLGEKSPTLEVTIA